MPVEITLPLTPLEQAVADARENERVMLSKVEDAKLILKAAKSAWEESVSEVFRALDEMIADKRQVKEKTLFDDVDEDGKAGAGESNPTPTPPVPAGKWVVTCDVQLIPPATLPTQGEPFPGAEPFILSATAAPAPDEQTDPVSPTVPTWRANLIAVELDAPTEVLSALEVFGVFTLGALADALQAGHTFNLKASDVADLKEVIQATSQEDEKPVRFDEAGEVVEAVKAEGVEVESDEAFAARTGKAEAPEPQPEPVVEPEPVKPAKKPRGPRKAKAAEVVAAETKAEPEPVAVAAGDDFDGL